MLFMCVGPSVSHILLVGLVVTVLANVRLLKPSTGRWARWNPKCFFAV